MEVGRSDLFAIYVHPVAHCLLRPELGSRPLSGDLVTGLLDAPQGMVLSAVNGVGLALVIPNAQSITADYYDELDRGKAFGALYMTSALGGAFGSLYATNQGQQLLASPAMLCVPLLPV